MDFTLNVAGAGTKTEGGPSSPRPTKGVWEVVYCSTDPADNNNTGEFGPPNYFAFVFLRLGIWLWPFEDEYVPVSFGQRS